MLKYWLIKIVYVINNDRLDENINTDNLLSDIVSKRLHEED